MSLPTETSPLGYTVWALGSSGMKPLFPGLRSLRITAAASELAPKVMATLACPTIRQLNLKFDGMHSPLNAPSVIETVNLTRSLELRTAFIKLTSRVPMCPSVPLAVADAIRSQRTLESLCFMGMAPHTMEMFAAASELKVLRALSLTEWEGTWEDIQDDDATFACAEEGGTFPSLKNISFSLTRVALPSALACITSPNLKHLTLRLKEPRGPGPYHLDSCLDNLRLHTRLATIQLTFSRTTSTWEDLLPLLACSRLQCLKLEGYLLPATIGDQELKNMAESWPLLEVLTIEYESCRANLARNSNKADERPRITLAGLVCLATHCPALRKLRLSIDASVVPDAPAFPVTGGKMKDISFPLSPVVSGGTGDRAIARFLTELWPNQEPPCPRTGEGEQGSWANTGARHPRWLQGDAECPIWERIWMMVYVYLSRCAGSNI